MHIPSHHPFNIKKSYIMKKETIKKELEKIEQEFKTLLHTMRTDPYWRTQHRCTKRWNLLVMKERALTAQLITMEA